MCDELLKSPMFNLSMASKELFHSNLLYWMSVTYPQLFLKILENLNIDTSSWEKQDWVSYREKNHFDLSLYLCNGKKEECLLIIENKVKSIPQIHQLRDYEEKKVTRHNSYSFPCVLSLVKSKIFKKAGRSLPMRIFQWLLDLFYLKLRIHTIMRFLMTIVFSLTISIVCSRDGYSMCMTIMLIQW